MNIVFFTHYVTLYGANRSLLNLIDGLQSYGHKLYFIAPSEGDITALLREKGFSVSVHYFDYCLDFKPRNEFKIASRLERQLSSLPEIIRKIIHWNIDLIYSNSSVIDIGFMAARLTNRPHLWHIREFGQLHYGLEPDLGEQWFREMMLQSDGLVFISQILRDYFIKSEPVSAQTKVIYNGVVTKNFAWELKGKQACKRRNGIRTFCLVGLIHENKGQQIAISALSLIKEKFPYIKLLIAGGGNTSTLKNMILSNGLKDNVEFLGIVENPFDVFLQSDVSLMCSKHEAMGRVTVEAMACSLPVIGFDSGATPELIQDGITGLLYKNGAESLADKMTYLIENPTVAKDMGEKAFHSFLELFTQERSVVEFETFAQKVVKNYQRREIRFTRSQESYEHLGRFFDLYEKILNNNIVNDSLIDMNQDNMMIEQNRMILKAKEMAENGNIIEAISIYEKLLETDSKNFKANFNLGILYYQQKELRRSAKCYLKCLEINPDDRNSTINCFYVLTEIGRSEDAEKIVAAYLVNHFDDQEMRNLLTVDKREIDIVSVKSNDKSKAAISFLVPTKQRYDLLTGFVNSLLDAVGDLDYEILILSADDENVQQKIKQFSSHCAVYDQRTIFGESKPTWSQMMNFLLGKANGKYFMFASDDILFEYNSVKEAFDFIEKADKSVAGVAMAYKNMISSNDWRRYGVDLTLGDKTLINYGLLNTSLAKSAGCFSDEYNFYCADGDLCLRLYEQGYDIIPVFSARVIHNNILDNVKRTNNNLADRDIAVYRKKWLTKYAPISKRRVYTVAKTEQMIDGRFVIDSNISCDEFIKEKFRIPEIRLHLGCGEQRFENYINIDYPPDKHNLMKVKADLFADITKLKFNSQSIAEIRLHHVFEHFNRVAALGLLIRWQQALQVGGILRIETPDLEGCARIFLSNEKISIKMGIVRHLAGDQYAQWGYHVDQWFKERFQRTLTELGFSVQSINQSNWQKEPFLANIEVIAIKNVVFSEKQLIEKAGMLLADSMVSPKEINKCNIWKSQLKQFLEDSVAELPLSALQTADLRITS